MARYVEKKEPLYVDIVEASTDHIAVIPGKVNDYPTSIGQMSTPEGLVPVFNNDAIIDYGPNATPRYTRMPAHEVSAFWQLAPEQPAAPALPESSSAEPVPSTEGGA